MCDNVIADQNRSREVFKQNRQLVHLLFGYGFCRGYRLFDGFEETPNGKSHNLGGVRFLKNDEPPTFNWTPNMFWYFPYFEAIPFHVSTFFIKLKQNLQQASRFPNLFLIIPS